MLREYAYQSFAAAVNAMADKLSRLIQDRLERSDTAVLAVGGGRTPRYVLPRLAAYDCGWDQVVVTLTDDRCVPADDPASNAGLVKSCMFRDFAASATFQGLYGVRPEILQLPNIVYLGFGEDGHIASLFPEGPELSSTRSSVVEVLAPVYPHARISLTMQALHSADHVVMLVSGKEKHRVYRKARFQASSAALPLARFLSRSYAPVSVYMDRA
jgi:6-phosphogluconolactonase